MSTSDSNSKKKGKKSKKIGYNNYSHDFRLRAVKLYLEEGFPASLIEKETGLSNAVLYRWAKLYREQGEAGLKAIGSRRNGKGQIPPAVREKIVEIKKQEPTSGIKRISQILRRLFFLKASPGTVRKTLNEQGLMNKPTRKKPNRNITRPRFFERTTPNQLWQTDIFTFRLGGKNAYLIGYIDDYSRYIVGLDLFMSQKADQVIEIYRRATSEYAVPKEMLTDNGRQYTNWRGTSRFEKEIKKDKLRHIKSSPHHPMTLGKIERFWKTIFQEFLVKAQFSSFDEARERIRLWVRYYNHKRPHQGIKGLCPADRYYEIRAELKKTIEQGIQENILEMALRGKPKPPFYMVGRMDGQSVVLRAEKGKLKLSVDGAGDADSQEMVYNLDKKDNIKEGDNTHGENHTEEKTEQSEHTHCAGEGESSAIGLDGAPKEFGDLSGVEHTVGHSSDVVEPFDGGDATGSGAESEPGEGPGLKSETSADAGQEAADFYEVRSTGEPSGGEVSESRGIQERQDPTSDDKEQEDNQEVTEGSMHEPGGASGPMEEAGQVDTAGPGREADSEGGSPSDGRIAEDLLRVGEAGTGGNGGCALERQGRPAGEAQGPGQGENAEEDRPSGEGPLAGKADSGGEGHAETCEGVEQGA
jgi:transposase InsO family protein